MAKLVKNLALNDQVPMSAADFGLSTAYVPRGSASVSGINSKDLSQESVGWVYNLSDSGTVNAGVGGTPFAVRTGDNVVLVEESVNGVATRRWDKLSATVTAVGAGDNILDAGGTLSVSLDKAAGAGGITGSTTLGDLLALLGGTTPADPE